MQGKRGLEYVYTLLIGIELHLNRQKLQFSCFHT